MPSIEREGDGSRDPLTVLIVEDDEGLRESLQDVVESAGYLTVTAPDGRWALEYIRRSRRRPCLVLLDLMMPNVDGWQVLAELERDGFPLRNVLVLTASSSVRVPPTVTVLYKPMHASAVLEILRTRSELIASA